MNGICGEMYRHIYQCQNINGLNLPTTHAQTKYFFFSKLQSHITAKVRSIYIDTQALM